MSELSEADLRAWDEALARSKPRQLAMARLMELTPELRAHYACPAEVECGHPDCQL